MEDKKIIFGLSPKATLVNSLILLFVSQLIWAIRFVRQVPVGTKELAKLNIEVEWYYNMPFELLSIIMLWRWVDFKFNFQPGDLSWRAIKYKYFLVGILFWLSTVILKFELLITLLPKI